MKRFMADSKKKSKGTLLDSALSAQSQCADLTTGHRKAKEKKNEAFYG